MEAFLSAARSIHLQSSPNEQNKFLLRKTEQFLAAEIRRESGETINHDHDFISLEQLPNSDHSTTCPEDLTQTIRPHSFGGEIDPARLAAATLNYMKRSRNMRQASDVIVSTVMGHESLASYVSRRFPSISKKEQTTIYHRLRALRARTLVKLRRWIQANHEALTGQCGIQSPTILSQKSTQTKISS